MSILSDTTTASGLGFVITCEHGGNRIPAPYVDFFRDQQDLLDSHRGFDAGSLIMARALARALSAQLVFSTVSRLLVDLNRSIGHPHLHFDAVPKVPVTLRQEILRHYYQPYRDDTERLVRQTIIDHGQVLHLSSHSFTPHLDGQQREADVGLLYDPARPGEVALSERWKAALQVCAPGITVRRNYPYAGKGDGLTRWFRQRLSPDAYIGIELEVNQKHVVGGGRQWSALRQVIVESLRTALTRRHAEISFREISA